MTKQLLGAILLIAGSFGISLVLVGAYRREVGMLRQIDLLIADISCELQYRMTPLPQLIRTECNSLQSDLKKLFLSFAEELESQIAPNVTCCLEYAFLKHPDIPVMTKRVLLELGNSLGRFDLQGQLTCLEAVQKSCRNELEKLEGKQAGYTKCCQAYCLCAGALIALILL